MNDRPLRALALWEWYRSADLRRESDQFEKYNPFTSSSLLTQAIAGIKDRTFLSYALLPHGLAVWIFDDRGIHGQILSEDPVQLMALSSYFYDICSTPDSDGPRLKAKGRDLYQKLIAPIAHWITRERILVIEADDWMNDLPFAALVDPQGRYLIEENTLSFSSGLLQEQRLRPAQPITKSANAVIIGSTLAPSSLGLLPIPNIGSEARTVAGKFIHPTLLLGSQASFSAVESTAPAAEVFHYVGHAISNLKEEGLVLAGKRPDEGTESIWGAGRWSYGLFKRAQLIVLAACSTGRMSRGRVETHGDLVRALLRAGVPRIVASRWNISSNETSDFISKFYDELLQGKSVPKALQSSSLNVMRDKPAPYYWAGLVEIGK
jgi:CHAT domain-containing protein